MRGNARMKIGLNDTHTFEPCLASNREQIVIVRYVCDKSDNRFS